MWKCRFGFHTWTKWELFGHWKQKGTNRQLAEIEKRRCAVCGKTQLEEIWY